MHIYRDYATVRCDIQADKTEPLRANILQTDIHPIIDKVGVSQFTRFRKARRQKATEKKIFLDYK